MSSLSAGHNASSYALRKFIGEVAAEGRVRVAVARAKTSPTTTTAQSDE